MPQAVENLVTKLLSQDDFYPDKDPDERKSLAFAIANKQLNEGKLEGSIEFVQINAPTQITIEATDQGDILAFRGAVLARSETNRNGDYIPPEGIGELATTIGGRPLDVEHRANDICGVFTAGRSIDNKELSVDGFIWADRYSDIAEGLKSGAHQLSIEAIADKAKCSVCGGEYESASEYCGHLTQRKKNGAKRLLTGLKAKGGAVTKSPAGTNTKFDPAQIYFVASHAEGNDVEGSWYDEYLKEGETIDDLPASDFADSEGRRFPYKIHGKVIEAGWRAAWSASHGGHTGVKDNKAIAKLKRDKPKGVEVQESMEVFAMKCPHCGKDNGDGMEKCEGCNKSMSASVIAGDLQEALAKLTALTTERDTIKASLDTATSELEVTKNAASASEKQAAELKAQLRRNIVGDFMPDDEWSKQRETILGMNEPAFNLLAASLSKKPDQRQPAGVRLPEPVAGGTDKEPLTL